jgi:type IV secretory pathway VirB9-like protein
MLKKIGLFLIMIGCSQVIAEQNITEVQKSQEVVEEIEGNYQKIVRESSIPLAAMQKAWDYAEQGAGVYIINFDPREIIKLTVREYMTTTVIFPVWESINEVIVGDEGNYQILKPKDNIVIIRPINYVGLDTSITMIGNSGHVYGFYVRVEGYNSKNISDITVRVIAPGPIMNNFKANKTITAKNDYLDEAYFDSSKLNFKFSMSGDETIAPNLVYSDGVRSWFEYGDKLDEKKIPTFYSVVDGYQQAINVTVDGDRLVAQGSGSFVLKSGDRLTCVYPTKSKKLK